MQAKGKDIDKDLVNSMVELVSESAYLRIE